MKTARLFTAATDAVSYINNSPPPFIRILPHQKYGPAA